ncbi:M20/M25/M40 family metallo-hydrolase [Alkalicella caledoniensis]|uniref:M20/M25/M40 family metallo-hydrolase n=1 Tax=Alkalicella caledoniensis TaxID=2731377 RepID=A0A7G9WAP6_ALKCA|nr:M20/M25/M40 family metallo-hydrolase [Alkalicella caledoniensis]QNO15758.1 M20/M25/M40 family metallo-hydrolase [Alkalicella caledoniensis]
MLNQTRLLETYYELIRVKSVSGNEQALADYLAKCLKDLGLEVKYTYYENSKNSPSIYSVLKGQGLGEGPTLLLTGHMDTVDVASGWNTDPFTPTIEGDKVYGLGACDMKGGLASIIETLRYIKENNVKLQGDITVAFVSDEEVQSRGTYNLLTEHGLKADMAIMAECRFTDAAVGFRGRYSINVSVKGKTGHASRYPNVGENAVISASKLAIAIEQLPTLVHPKIGEGTWCIRHIEGGIKNTLSVPDKCDLLVDRYVVPGESFDTCRDQILNAAKSIGLQGKVEVTLVHRPLPYMESFVIDENLPIVKSVVKNFRNVTGKEIELSYDKSVCDSNFLVTIGNIPTITFGPSGKNLHQSNEFGLISEILDCTKIYIDVIQDLLG